MTRHLVVYPGTRRPEQASTVRLASASAWTLDRGSWGVSARMMVEGSLSRVIDEWVTAGFVFVLFRVDVQRARVT